MSQLPAAAHTSQPWQIHQWASDFRLLDVWALRTPGGPDDFPRLVEIVTAYEPLHSSSRPVRTLFAIRLKLGQFLHLGDPDPTSSLFVPMFQTPREWAGELENKTVQGILHLGWVQDGADRYHGQLAVLVKPNGLLGRTYLAAISPLRHRVVYPTMLRELEARWHD